MCQKNKIEGLQQQCALLFKWLKATETMRMYIAQYIDDNEKLRSKLKMIQGELAAAWTIVVKGAELQRKVEEEKKATNVEACRLKEEEEAAKAKCKKAKQKNERLRKEIEELRVRFAAQNEELEGEYQKQADDIFLFDYWCCMKKNGITQDTPSYPPDDEDAATGDPAQGNGDIAVANPSSEQT